MLQGGHHAAENMARTGLLSRLAVRSASLQLVSQGAGGATYLAPECDGSAKIGARQINPSMISAPAASRTRLNPRNSLTGRVTLASSSQT